MSEINNNVKQTGAVEAPKQETKVAVANNTAVANTGFNVVANIEALNEAMSSDCQGLEFTFDKVKLPTGGGVAFEMPSLESDEPEMVKEINGVILHHHPAFSYYKEKYNGSNNPPECFSIDGKVGQGTPGGVCAECPFNVYGSGENDSKACKNKRMIYILMAGEMFPYMLNLPTGSLKAFTQFVKSNLSKGRKLSRIVTKFTLKKATNKSGIAYSQAVFSFDRELNEEEIKSIAPLIELVKDYSVNHVPAKAFDNGPDDDIPYGDEAK